MDPASAQALPPVPSGVRADRCARCGTYLGPYGWASCWSCLLILCTTCAREHPQIRRTYGAQCRHCDTEHCHACHGVATRVCAWCETPYCESCARTHYYVTYDNTTSDGRWVCGGCRHECRCGSPLTHRERCLACSRWFCERCAQEHHGGPAYGPRGRICPTCAQTMPLCQRCGVHVSTIETCGVWGCGFRSCRDCMLLHQSRHYGASSCCGCRHRQCVRCMDLECPCGKWTRDWDGEVCGRCAGLEPPTYQSPVQDDRRDRSPRRRAVRVHAYSYRPRHRFYGEGPLYLGIEIETDENGWTRRVASLASRLYLKHDASAIGPEIVTHPHDLPRARVLVRRLARRLRNVAVGDAGMHIHVSRRALSQDQIARLQRFFAEPLNGSAIDQIAGRSENEYCRREPSGDDRYRAVNVTNRSTIEIRVFRATLDADELVTRLEFVASLIEYLRDHDDVRWDSYAAWVSERADYPSVRRAVCV